MINNTYFCSFDLWRFFRSLSASVFCLYVPIFLNLEILKSVEQQYFAVVGVFFPMFRDFYS